MEVQGGGRPRVAAEDAGAAGLVHEDLLDLSAATIDRFGPTTLAAKAIGTTTHQHHRTVVGTVPFAGVRARRSCIGRRGEPLAAWRREVVALQPVPYGRVAHAELLGHRADRHAGLDERLERFARDAA